MTLGVVLTGFADLSLLIWLYLTFAHYGFWRRREFLPPISDETATSLPAITSLTPARNEAELVARTLSSILGQSYNGPFHTVLIDDSSTDGTSDIANNTAKSLRRSKTVDIIQAPELEKGWSGKLSALQTGLDHTRENAPDYYWLSDADIEHDSHILRRLVHWAQTEDIALVSLMVTLNCNNFWEKRITPAFIYYFQLLYPFAAVNNPAHKIGGAAGGCILIRRDAIEAIGGFLAIKDKLIDDCELGKAVKAKGFKTWLGHGTESRSIRPSSGLKDLWKMVARTAFVQLNYSYIYLFLAIFGMLLIYTLPVFATIYGAAVANWLLAIIGGAAWSLMAITFSPTLRAYKRPWIEGFVMPLTALLFMGMTLHAAWLHLRGSHSGWHDRIYAD